MSSRLDYRLVNFVLACLGGAIAVYVAVAVPAPHAAGTPLLVPLEHSSSPVVYVTGAVQHPGLYQVPPGSRLLTAVQAAGGLAPGAQTEGLNMARIVKDEEMIVVSSTSTGTSTSTSSATPSAAPTGCLANTATAEELAALPGLSAKVAERIVAYRAQHGDLTRAEDLRNIPGCKRRWRKLAEALGLELPDQPHRRAGSAMVPVLPVHVHGLARPI